ncbi:MAG: hypothetical protein AAGE94_19600 [Acidobacteriota bacterium]
MNDQIVSYHVTIPTHYPTTTYINAQTNRGQNVMLKFDDVERARQVLDLLRNEGPVFTDGRGTLFTGKEPIGEGE